MRRGWLVLLATVLVAAPAFGGGVVDVEIFNHTRVKGRLNRPGEIETYRLQAPQGAELWVSVAGRGRAPKMLISLYDAAGNELAADFSPIRKGEAVRGLAVPASELVRIDVSSSNGKKGDYVLKAAWRFPTPEAFDGTVGTTPTAIPFLGEEGALAKVRLRTRGKGTSGRITRLEGPDGWSMDVPAPARARSRHRVKGVILPGTGAYTAYVAAGGDGVAAKAKVTLKLPKLLRWDTRDAERRGAFGTTHLVTRCVGPSGLCLDVPKLAPHQLVSIDNSGVIVDLPTDALPIPAILTVATDDEDIADPLGFAPAGVVVELDAEGNDFLDPVSVSLPFDVGAFHGGALQDNVCVLKRENDGAVLEFPPSSLTIDEGAGTISVPTTSFSSFQVFAPPQELVTIARPGFANDVSVPPDEDVVYLSADLVAELDGAAAVFVQPAPGEALELFAGGGFATGDYAPRLDFDFDGDLLGGVVVSAVHAGANGFVVVVTADLDRIASLVYLVWPDGTVLRIAGDGTPFLDESLPARQTGIPHCCGAEIAPDGSVLVVTDAYEYPASDRVLRIDLNVQFLDEISVATIAGGGGEDVSGHAPLATRLFGPRSILLDSQGRILIGDFDWLLRFDLTAGTTETLAGTNFGETQPGALGGRAMGGQGAPLRSVVAGALEDLAFVPGTNEEILLAADPYTGIVWRFDLKRDRAWTAAGRRLNFDEDFRTRDFDADLVDPLQPLNYPTGVAPLGDEIYITELLDDRVRVLRPVD